MKFKINKTTDGKYNWTLYASNGQAVAGHNQGYNRPTNLVAAVERHIVRGDQNYREALTKALEDVGYGPTGHVLKSVN